MKPHTVTYIGRGFNTYDIILFNRRVAHPLDSPVYYIELCLYEKIIFMYLLFYLIYIVNRINHNYYSGLI